MKIFSSRLEFRTTTKLLKNSAHNSSRSFTKNHLKNTPTIHPAIAKPPRGLVKDFLCFRDCKVAKNSNVFKVQHVSVESLLVFKVHGKDSLGQFETVVDCLSERLLSPKVEQSSECPKPPRR